MRLVVLADEQILEYLGSELQRLVEGLERFREALNDVEDVASPVVLSDGVGKEPVPHVLFLLDRDAGALEFLFQELPPRLVLGLVAGEDHDCLVSLHPVFSSLWTNDSRSCASK